MAKKVRKPPGPSDYKDPRAMEYFFNDLYEQHSITGVATIDLPSLSSGSTTTFTISAPGARPGKQQTVEYGLPESWNPGLMVSAAFVSADDTVTMAIYNGTGGAINMGPAVYSVRVRP